MSAKTQAAPQITGHGHTHDGRRCFAVQSQSEANRWYIVVVNLQALACDCVASAKYGKVCKHRKAVHDLLVAERDARRVADREAAKAASLVRDTAPLYRSNSAFSIFKQ